jgi:hypothetical protein
VLLAVYATADVSTTQYVGAPRFQPTEPNAVQILRTEPTMAHDRLGEIVVDASVEPAPPITEIEKTCRDRQHGFGASGGAGSRGGSTRGRWTIRFQMIPVIPALVKDPLFK